MADSTPALVLGSGMTALGVVRCLGRAAIPSACVSEKIGVVALSRWCRRTDDLLAGPEGLAAFLEGLSLSRAVLFPCADDWVLAAASLPAALAGRFPSSRAPRETVDILVNKRRFGEALDRLDVPHPRTTVVRSAADLECFSEAELVGSFLKPCDSQACSAKYHAKGFSIVSKADGLERLRRLTEDGLEFVLQDYVPGPQTNHFHIDGFVDRHGTIRARFVRQRLRVHPPRYGNSSLIVSVPPRRARGAMESLERLLPALRYRGIFSAEFKFDDRDGLFKLLEINARPWWYVEFPALCGIDVCSMAYRDALGLDVESRETYPEGKYYVNLRTDIGASLLAVRAGELTWGAAVSSWLRARQAIFRLDDPMPAIGDFAERAGKWWRERRAPLASGAA